MNNFCFRTVVLAIKSAERQHCRRKTKKTQQCRKASKIGTVEQLFLAFLYPSTVLKHNTVSEKKKIVKQCRKLSKDGTVEQHTFWRCCTNPQQCRNTTLPKKKTTFSRANNHQKLALMNNLCFGTVVPTTASAKYNLDAGK